jgi:hypothetical protein
MAGIEREQWRNGRDNVEQGIFAPYEVIVRGNALGERWTGQELRFVAEGRNDAWDEGSSTMKRKLRTSQRKSNIDVERMPKGMTRQVENGTTLNQRTKRINWQVEWLDYTRNHTMLPKRLLHKVMEDEPIFEAFTSALELGAHNKGGNLADNAEDNGLFRLKKRRKLRKEDLLTSQHQASGAWNESSYSTQCPFTKRWGTDAAGKSFSWETESQRNRNSQLRYFLRSSKSSPKELVSFDPADSLSTILPGRTILEFPTIAVLQPGDGIPPGHVLGNPSLRHMFHLREESSELESEDEQVDSRKRKHQQQEEAKAKDEMLTQLVGTLHHTLHAAKKRKTVRFAPIQEIEEGEVISDNDDGVMDTPPTSDWDTTDDELEGHEVSIFETGEQTRDDIDTSDDEGMAVGEDMMLKPTPLSKARQDSGGKLKSLITYGSDSEEEEV